MALAGAALLVVAALAFPRHPSAPGDDAGTRSERRDQPANIIVPGPSATVLAGAAIAAPVAASATAAPHAASAPSKTVPLARPEKNRTAESAKSGAAIATVRPVAEIPLSEAASTLLPRSEVSTAPAPVSVTTGVGGNAPVTLTGCLEVSVNQDAYRLTDIEGADAPKSRSWRTGFLKKRSAPVALVEPPDRLALQTNVGRRVMATGLLISHDLKVSALRVVGSSCN